MKVVIQRSEAAHESAESVVESIAIEDIHALLYRRGEIDVAEALTATLTPVEACAVAARLRRVIRRAARRRFFRDYRTALRPDEAARLGLIALWYERAGQAGCRVWADLRTDLAPAPRLTLVGAPAPEAEETEGVPSDDLAPPEPTRLMPEWLTAPESSVWSA